MARSADIVRDDSRSIRDAKTPRPSRVEIDGVHANAETRDDLEIREEIQERSFRAPNAVCHERPYPRARRIGERRPCAIAEMRRESTPQRLAELGGHAARDEDFDARVAMIHGDPLSGRHRRAHTASRAHRNASRRPGRQGRRVFHTSLTHPRAADG